MTESQEASTLEDIVTVDAATAVKIAVFLEAKRVQDAANARVEALKGDLNALFAAAGAKKFADASGAVLLSRVEVQNPQAYNWVLLNRLAPKAVERAKLPRTTHYRLNPPRR